jgi:heterodisulfide reductase subunit C
MADDCAERSLVEMDSLPLRRALLDEAAWSAELDYCMTCGKCTSVCPLHGFSSMDPRKVVRLIMLGEEQEVSDSDFF